MHPDTFKILLVDDTPANLELLIDYLTKANFEIFVAENGRSALERLHYVQPDLILLDILMPEMNGFEVCKIIKTHPLTRYIPVIFLSAREETADKLKGFAVGGIDYITKPWVEAEVLARVRTHLHLARMHRYLREENYKLQRHLAHQTLSLKQESTLLTASSSADLPTVQLTLMGSFHLVVNGEERTYFRSDTVRALLAYLVLEGRTPLPRTALAEFFWPSYTVETRLNSLRVALHNLRQLLTPLADLLVADRRQVVFRVDRDRLWCDALALETGFSTNLLDNGKQAVGAPSVTAKASFLAEFDAVASAPFQRWRRQRQVFYTTNAFVVGQ